MWQNFWGMVKNLNKDIYIGKRRESNIKIIAVCCLFFVFLLFPFVLLNFKQHLYYSAGLTIFNMVTFAVASAIAWFKKNRRIPAILVTVCMAILCSIYTIDETTEGFAILWAVIFPVAIMYFLDVRLGIAFSFYFELLFIFCFYTPFRSYFHIYSEIFMSRFPLLYFCIIVIDVLAMVQYHNNTLESNEYNERLRVEVDKQTKKADERADKISEMSIQVMQTLANAIDAKDTYTNEHSFRVAKYSVCLARALGWSERRISQLKHDAMVHDIGKIGVPDAILNKDGKLTSDEYGQIKSHTTAGFQICENAKFFPNAKYVVRYHHERYDGTGYPDGLKGNEIPESARVVAIADAFDAMNSDRVYRKALSMDKIIEELRNGAGTQFDPNFVNIFIHLIETDQLPLGSKDFQVTNEIFNSESFKGFSRS